MINELYKKYYSLFEEYGDISLQKEEFALDDKRADTLKTLFTAYEAGILRQIIATIGIVPRIKEVFSGDIDELINRINSHDNLSSIECIYISNEISELADLEKLKNTYPDKEIVVYWNDELAFIDDAISAVYMINYFKSIMSDELSPLEKITIAYDIAKSHYYKEKDIKHTIASRYITDMVSNDYIVCHGYVNIFNRLLEEAGIRVLSLILLMKQGEQTVQHVRSVAYVVDEKYGLDAYCIFDPTFDSINNNEYYYKIEGDSIVVSAEKKEGYQSTDSLCLYKYFLVPLPLYEATFPNSFDENLTTRKNKKGNKKITYEGLHTGQLEEGTALTNMEFIELLYNVKLAEGYSEDEIPILISQSFALSKNKKFTTNSIVEAISEIKSKKESIAMSD